MNTTERRTIVNMARCAAQKVQALRTSSGDRTKSGHELEFSGNLNDEQLLVLDSYFRDGLTWEPERVKVRNSWIYTVYPCGKPKG